MDRTQTPPLQPEITVVIPAYNCAAVLGEALDSLLDQTGVLLEIVVVDDGSTDGTATLLASLADTRVRSLRQENRGPGAARNAGIRAARSGVIAFLDADDVLLPESLRGRFDIFRRYPGIDFVFADAYVELHEGTRSALPFYKERKMLDTFKDCIGSSEGQVYFLNKRQSDCSLRSNLFPWTGTVMVRKQALVDTGLFDEQLRAGEDKLMWLKIMKNYRVAYYDYPCAVYKKYRSGLTRDFERYCVDSIANARMFLESECAGASRAHTRVMRHKISDHYFELGYHYFRKDHFSPARRNFLGAVRYHPGDLKSYAYLAASMLPYGFIRLLRRRPEPGRKSP